MILDLFQSLTFGPVWTMTATASAAVTGPYCVGPGDVYVPGGSVGCTYLAGSGPSDVYQPGGQVGEVCA